jgi:hypothetical protein
VATYTYVSYFMEDDVAPIKAEAAALRADFEHRMGAMEPEAVEACKTRLFLVEKSIELLTEPVPRPYGG